MAQTIPMKATLCTSTFRLWCASATLAVLCFSAAGKPDAAAKKRAAATIEDVEKGTPAGWRALLDHAAFSRAVVWSRWAAADPAACYEELRRQPGWQKPLPAGPGFVIRLDDDGHLLPDSFLTHLFKAWMEKDPDAALAAVETVPAHLPTADIRGQMLHQLLVRDAIKAVPVIRRMARTATISLPSADRWTITDHAALAAELQTLPGGSLCDGLRDAFAVNWSRKDATAALLWASGLHLHNRPHMLDNVLTPLKTAPPDVCMAALGQLPAGNFRCAAARIVAEWQGRTHGEAAWLAAETPGLLPEMLPALFDAWAAKEARAAFAFAVKQPPPMKDALMDTSLWRLSEKYPALGGPEAAKLPDGPVKVRLLGRLIPDWVKADAEGAATWVQGLPPTPHAAFYTALIYEHWAKTNPDHAVARTQQLPEPLREPALIAVFRQWATRDRAAATATAAALPAGADRIAAEAGLAAR